MSKLLTKEQMPQVALGFMNEIHAEEVEIINAIVAALHKDEEIEALLERFVQHCEEHFRIEEEHMQAYNFFAYDCHSGEHQRVINELQEVVKHTKSGNNPRPMLLHYFTTVLPEWMLNHIHTMDTVTANFIAQMQQQSAMKEV